jgi:hypothetical protein
MIHVKRFQQFNPNISKIYLNLIQFFNKLRFRAFIQKNLPFFKNKKLLLILLA